MKQLVISDLHFGSEQSLAAIPELLDRLVNEVAWADEVVLNGDVWSFVSADMQEAVEASKPLFRILSKYARRVVFISGNHDHHLMVMDRDTRALADTIHELPGPSVVERLICYLAPNLEVEVAYPAYISPGVSFIHGHQINAHNAITGFLPLDRRYWKRLIAREIPQRSLTPDEYEALLAPLFEAGLQARRYSRGLVRGHNARLYSQLRFTMTNPMSRFSPATVYLGSWLQKALHTQISLRPFPASMMMLRQVASDHQLPAGLVVYSHTHQAHGEEFAAGEERWTFANSGAWILDKTLLAYTSNEGWCHPGTVLRVDDGRAQLRKLLDDLSVRELQQRLDHYRRNR